jgi:hypothetical protein
MGSVILLLGIRNGIIRLLGWIFNMTDYVKQYLFNKKLINEYLGLVLFPLCILILLSSGKVKLTLLIIGAVIYAVMFGYSYLRNIPLLRNLFSISFIHFFLYICTFEVIPVLILLKMIR